MNQKIIINLCYAILLATIINLCKCEPIFKSERTLGESSSADGIIHQNRHHHHHHQYNHNDINHEINDNDDDSDLHDSDNIIDDDDDDHHQGWEIHAKSHSRIPLNDLPQWVGEENFILTDYLADGELERRISFNGITAKETSIGYNSSKTLSLWQITDGLRFIQLIYSNPTSQLIDCEYVRQKGLISNFLHKYYNEIDSARSRNFTSPTSSMQRFVSHQRLSSIISNHEFNRYVEDNVVPEDYNELQDVKMNLEHEDGDAFGMRNLSYQRIEHFEDIPEDMRQWLNYNQLKMKCYQRHRELKKLVQGLNSKDEEKRKIATEHVERQKRDILSWFIVPNTKWCGRGQLSSNYNSLGGASRADKCCRKHDHCRVNIAGMTTKYQLFNYFPYTISHCSCDMRQRRDLSSLLRVPGTKWCGVGWSAKKYSDLGGYSKADRCCRQHDKSCPFWITGFETKYGLYNWRISTLMHCRCDERFRTCLKMSDSSDANMVGKLFFNIVQTKCFVLKTEKICKKRSWWGKCEKKVLRKRAHLRNNRKF